MHNLAVLTQATDELPEVDECVSVLVEQAEEAQGQGVGVRPVGPGEQQVEQPPELLHVHAVLLQVRQAGVVALRGVAAAAPVTAGQVLRLERGKASDDSEMLGENKTGEAPFIYNAH